MTYTNVGTHSRMHDTSTPTTHTSFCAAAACRDSTSSFSDATCRTSFSLFSRSLAAGSEGASLLLLLLLPLLPLALPLPEAFGGGPPVRAEFSLVVSLMAGFSLVLSLGLAGAGAGSEDDLASDAAGADDDDRSPVGATALGGFLVLLRALTGS
jgi:hypothetical protein